MDIHKNARSCPASRALLVERVEAGWSVAAAARAIGLSARRGREYVRRYRQEGPEGLLDRSSRPHRLRSTAKSVEQHVVQLRTEQHLTCRQIALRVGRSHATVARLLGRHQLARHGGAPCSRRFGTSVSIPASCSTSIPRSWPAFMVSVIASPEIAEGSIGAVATIRFTSASTIAPGWPTSRS